MTSVTDSFPESVYIPGMFSGRLTQVTLHLLDRLLLFPAPKQAAHLKTGQRGEEDAYFYLRRLGYIMVARNFRSPRRRGEIDLIGWDKDVLCFIEVKTRTSHDVKPAEAAVDRPKKRELSAVAREYLRHLPPECHCRFDVVSVYYEQAGAPQFELFQNAFAMA
ncbi:MAG TPA: YraN family protein [Terriglobales bacterium]